MLNNPVRDIPNIKSFLNNRDAPVISEEDKELIKQINNKSIDQFCTPSIELIAKCITNNKEYQLEMEKYQTRYWFPKDIMKKAPDYQKQFGPINDQETYYPAQTSTNLFRACSTVLLDQCKKKMEEKGLKQYFRE